MDKSNSKMILLQKKWQLKSITGNDLIKLIFLTVINVMLKINEKET
jgi:hypothetical protein